MGDTDHNLAARCACDVPAHAYTYSWEGNPYWSRAYVGSLELFDYFKGRAKAYGVDDFLKLQHRVDKAVWSPKEGRWEVSVQDLKHEQVFIDKAEVLINAAGFLKYEIPLSCNQCACPCERGFLLLIQLLSKWKWPDIADIGEFKGQLTHSAQWDDSYDFTGKRVAIIGSGSSAIQIVPELQPGKHSSKFFALHANALHLLHLP